AAARGTVALAACVHGAVARAGRAIAARHAAGIVPVAATSTAAARRTVALTPCVLDAVARAARALVTAHDLATRLLGTGICIGTVARRTGRRERGRLATVVLADRGAHRRRRARACAAPGPEVHAGAE